MTMFEKLFEILPDAEQLLSLSAEELAGPLLVSLKNREKILPAGVIKYDIMEWEIEKGSSRRNPSLNYPRGSRDDVLFALMEAWQCLVYERFVAPRPTHLAGGTNISPNITYFITRKGQKIQTLNDFEDYRKADLLRKHQLHDIIAEKVWSIFAQGSYRTSVLEAFIQVEIAVREVGGYAKGNYGTNLMRQAFNVNDGKLTDPQQETAEKQAMSDMFAGAIGLYKNPSSHREVEYAPEEAAEIIIIASQLLRIVDSCKERIANAPT